MAYFSYIGGNILGVSTGNPPILAPVWPDFTFPHGVVGVVYSGQWDLRPAFAPTTYTLVAGSLPPGLALSNISADLGKIEGTPTTPGTYNFTLTASNLYGAVSKSFPLAVVAAAGGAGGGAWAFLG